MTQSCNHAFRLTGVRALALAALLTFGALPSSAQAWDCGGYGIGPFGGPYGIGFGGFGSPYAMGRIPTPPYFALHPPVYYSVPVARTYGYSPFAYPGTVPTPEVEVEPTPQVIVNPFVTPTAGEPGTIESSQPNPNTSADVRDPQQVASAPLLIINPYVIDEVPAGPVRLAHVD